MNKLLTLLFLFNFIHIPTSMCAQLAQKPRVSIITSLFKGQEFIEGFLADIVQQTIFNECELIIINANSPENEDPYIYDYMTRYPNIIYYRLDHDPGIYGVWNMAIKIARADLISNANIDDRRNPEFLEITANILEQDHSIDLVYGDYLITYQPHETFAQNNATLIAIIKEFSPSNMYLCLPGPQPTWRKSLHEKYGYFNENYKFLGDHEMWLRAVERGAVFKKINYLSGLYFLNPTGLSTDTNIQKTYKRNLENAHIIQHYEHVWKNFSP